MPRRDKQRSYSAPCCASHLPVARLYPVQEGLNCAGFGGKWFKFTRIAVFATRWLARPPTVQNDWRRQPTPDAKLCVTNPQTANRALRELFPTPPAACRIFTKRSRGYTAPVVYTRRSSTLPVQATGYFSNYHRRPRHLAALLKTDVRPADKRWRIFVARSSRQTDEASSIC